MFGYKQKIRHAFNYKHYPNKINIGCGYDIKEGFLNVDLTDVCYPDLVADTINLHMLPSGYYEYLYAKDVLEHVPRTKAEIALTEWHRILKPCGEIFIQVPNIINLAEMLKWVEHSDISSQKGFIQCLFGTQAHEGDFHFSGFTPSQLEFCMRKIGFHDIKMNNVDYWMMAATAKKTVDDRAHPELLFGYGFYHEEDEASGFRWSQAESQIILNNAEKVRFVIECRDFKEQVIFYHLNNYPPVQIALNNGGRTEVTIANVGKHALIKFESNISFCPYWYDNNDDRRKLSFAVSDFFLG